MDGLITNSERKHKGRVETHNPCEEVSAKWQVRPELRDGKVETNKTERVLAIVFVLWAMLLTTGVFGAAIYWLVS